MSNCTYNYNKTHCKYNSNSKPYENGVESALEANDCKAHNKVIFVWNPIKKQNLDRILYVLIHSIIEFNSKEFP